MVHPEPTVQDAAIWGGAYLRLDNDEGEPSLAVNLQVFIAWKHSIQIAPPTAPSSYIADGIERTPVDKMSLRKIEAARIHPTVR